MQRRDWLVKLGGILGSVTVAGKSLAGSEAVPAEQEEQVGTLVDTTLCIGCRQCEDACNRRNKLPRPLRPFSDRTVLRQFRRPEENAFTVVNEFAGRPSPDQPLMPTTFIKSQCMHCLTPACVSACVVGALRKAPDGAVIYNSEICLGCRYCMVACPFEIPAYQYLQPLTPRVRKCQFCADGKAKAEAHPACAAACPTEALVFAPRAELLTLAHARISKRPDRYSDYVYGEKEAGGTAWLYLTGRPWAELGLLSLAPSAPSKRTEAIQHGIFRFGAIPLAVYSGLAGIMWLNKRREQKKERSPAAPGGAS
jgi:formate dehydrogenase iron-sulfur subunit